MRRVTIPSRLPMSRNRAGMAARSSLPRGTLGNPVSLEPPVGDCSPYRVVAVGPLSMGLCILLELRV